MMRIALLLLLLPIAASASLAATPRAADQVRQGIRHYQAREYDEAARAFDAAGEALPDDPRVAFDRATAYAAQGQYDEATRLFQQSALARDADLALRSRYNLAGVAGARAAAALGKTPEAASPPARQEALRWLSSALDHYRDVLRIDPRHADARHNVELIRLWTRAMQARWKERDRQQARQQPLVEYLRWLESRQRELRTQTAELAQRWKPAGVDAERDAAAQTQDALADEIGPLREKIAAELGSPSPAGTSRGSAPGPASSGALEEVVAALQKRAGDAGRWMSIASKAIKAGKPGEAAAAQASAIEQLDAIVADILPFASLVHQAIERQQQEIGRVAPAVEKPDPAQPLNGPERAWEERFINRWSQRLVRRAQAGRQQAREAEPPTGAAVPRPDTARPQSALEKALKLGPAIVKLTREAADALEAALPAEALPKQREALRLLKELAESLPPENQPQQKPQDDKDQQQPASASQPSDPGRSDEHDEQEKSGEQPNPSPDATRDGRSKSPRPRQNPSPESKQPSAGSAQQREGELTPDEVEAILRRARQRTAERLERERAFERRRFVPDPVDKDW